MITKLLIFGLFIHWIADFILQTDWQAKNKSTNNKALLYHVIIYSSVWLIAMLFVVHPITAVLFALITFVAHFSTDYVTSRINKHFLDKGDMHNKFVSIGFDQILHYLQLYFTFIWLV